MIRETISRSRFVLSGAILLAPLAVLSHGQVVVSSQQKVSGTAGGFPAGLIEAGDRFGTSAAALGDLDGDGVLDLAVGATGDDDGGSSSFFTGFGAVWILFQNADGTVKSTQKISNTNGNLTGVLDISDDFGSALAGLGDLDGDGVADLAVGASGDDDIASGSGAVWVFFLNADGTVKAEQKISNLEGGFNGGLNSGDGFGSSLANLGDVDGDGVTDLVVGTPGVDDGDTNAGAVWVLFMNTDGTVKAQQKISATSGNFVGSLAAGDAFGTGVGGLEDWNGDTVPDLIVGATGDDEVGADRGAAYILFLTQAGTVSGGARVGSSDLAGLGDGDAFGSSFTLAKLSGGATPQVVVGAPLSDAGGSNRGAIWVLSLDSAGLLLGADEISSTAGSFAGPLSDNDLFGASLASLGDQNMDSLGDIFVGAALDDDGGSATGAAWSLFGGLVATAVTRNGSGVNPVTFVQTSPAILNHNWGTTIDIITPGASASIVAIGGTPTNNIFPTGIFAGEILVLSVIFPIDIAAGVHTILVPASPGLTGVKLFTQGATVAAGDIRLTNALDVVIGTQ